MAMFTLAYTAYKYQDKWLKTNVSSALHPFIFLRCCFFLGGRDDILISLDNRFIFVFGINSYNHIYKGYGILHLITMVVMMSSENDA